MQIRLFLSLTGVIASTWTGNAIDSATIATVANPVASASTGSATDPSKLPDSIDKGIIRAWPADIRPGTTNRAGAGQTIIVEIRNLDGWLMDRLDYGQMTDAAQIRSAPPEVKKLISEHAFRFAVSAALWMEQYERSVLEDTQAQPDPATELAELRRYYVENDTDLNRFQPPPLSEDNSDKIRELLSSFKTAKLFIVSLTSSVKKDLTLCINRIVLTGVRPENPTDPPVDKSLRPPGNPVVDTYHWLRFTMRRDATNAADWDLLLVHPAFSIPSSVSVRIFAGSDTYDLPTAVAPDSPDPRCHFFLEGMPYLPFWSSLAVIAFVIVVFWRYAGRTDLIRDPDGPLRADGRRPFSLAKAQMAMWFFLILGSFAFLWAATGKITTLNDTCLWLIGIGSGTALGAAVIAAGRNAKQLERYPESFDYTWADERIEEELQDEITKAKKNLQGIQQTGIAEQVAAAVSRVEALEKQLTDFRTLPRRKWQRVIENWLSENDSDGTWSFHRFQMLGWTLVLGLIFFFKVASERNIPEFNTQLLALMGISAGTYIGFKLPPKAGEGSK
jgi:hypothetical protein